MDLEKQQAALARLYTDTGLLQCFLEDPAGTAAQVGLLPDEATALVEVAGRGLQRFAAGLVSKRLIEAQRLLAATAALLGPRFDELFRAYAREHSPPRSDLYRQDAWRFARCLGRMRDLSPVVRSTARYEALWGLARCNKPYLRFACFFNCRPARASAVTRVPLEQAPLSSFVCLWLRLRPGGRLYFWS